MNCKEFLENLNDFVEGELTRGKDSEMYEHMKTCQNCKETFDKEVSIKKALDGVFDVSKENYSSKKSSIMNSLDKGKYKRRHKVKIAAWLAAAAVMIICLPLGAKYLKNAIRPAEKTIIHTNTTGIADYFPLKQNTHMVYEVSGAESSTVETYTEYTDDKSIQIKSIGANDFYPIVYSLKTGSEIDEIVFPDQELFRVNKLDDADKALSDKSNFNVILKAPIAIGNTWTDKGAKYTITSTNADINTPLGNFKAVEVTKIQPKTSSAMNSKEYYVKDIGLVKSIIIDPSGKVVSERALKKIDYDKPFELKYTIYYCPKGAHEKSPGTPLAYTISKEYKTNEDMKNALDTINNLLKTPPKEVTNNNGLAAVLSNNDKINSINIKDNKVTIDLKDTGSLSVDPNHSVAPEAIFNEKYQYECIRQMVKTLLSFDEKAASYNISFIINGTPFEPNFGTVSFKNAVSVNNESIYKLYSTDVNTGRQLSTDITIANSLSLNEKLNTITSKLSQVYFKNLPIKVLKIEEINGKKIATIDLEESDANKKKSDMADYSEPNWAAGFLQGSTGAGITSSSIINSFLQKNMKGEWIDGIKVLYNNKPCEFEHAPALNDTIYR